MNIINIKHYKLSKGDKFNMCLTIPGKVIEIGKDKFVIDYGNEKREAIMSVIDVKVGDYVIVSNKIIVTKLTKEEAKKTLELIK